MNKLMWFVAAFVLGAGAVATDEPQYLTDYTDSFKEYMDQ